MQKLSTPFTCLFLLLSLNIFSQRKFKFGEFDKERFLNMNYCPVDSSAGAFVIEDYGLSWLNGAYEMEFQYHGIIKILSKDQFDRANIKIRHSNDDRIGKFNAATYVMEDGEIKEYTIKRNEGLVEKINDSYNSFNFTFPNVKEGAIIEYSYRVTSGSLARLKTWTFQTSIPVLKSQYEVLVPNFFDYERLLQGYIPLNTADVDAINRSLGGEGTRFQHHNYVALNVPAFKKEPYMTTVEDHISKIDFELKKYRFPGQLTKTYLPENYEALAKSMYISDYWHGSITDSKFTRDQVALIKTTATDNQTIAESIFYYVRDNFEEDYDGDYPTLKKVFNYKKGTAAQINRILGAMLHESGFDVNLVRLSTRSNGKINPYVPMASQFNFTIVQVRFDGVSYLLDASDKNTPFEALPKYCLNGKGLVVTDGEQWVDLVPFSKNGTTYSGEFEVLEDGIISGAMTVRRQGYEAWEFKNKLQKDGADDYKKSFHENRETWLINRHEISDLEKGYQMDESLELEIEDKIDDLGDILYLNPIVIGQLTDNPFKSQKREYPVNYGAPSTTTYLLKYRLAESLIVEELPETTSLALPNNSGLLLYDISNFNNELTVTCRIQINKSEFSVEEYAYLREFYAQLVEKQGEQIVLRRI